MLPGLPLHFCILYAGWWENLGSFKEASTITSKSIKEGICCMGSHKLSVQYTKRQNWGYYDINSCKKNNNKENNKKKQEKKQNNKKQ